MSVWRFDCSSRGWTCLVLVGCIFLFASPSYAIQHYNLSIFEFKYRPGVPVHGQDLTNNVGVAFFDGSIYSTFRRLRVTRGPRRSNGIPVTTWVNNNYLCTLSPENYEPSGCQEYDPTKQQQCTWPKSVDAAGIEDARLLTWSGKGLYTMFQAKPYGEGICNGMLQQPFLAMVKAEASAAAGDPWLLPEPIALNVHRPVCHPTPANSAVAAHQQPCHPELLSVFNSKKQKNWAPFFYEGQLFFSANLLPHVVLSCTYTGNCTVVHVSTNDSLFSHTKHLGFGPRGNTPTILIPTSLSNEEHPFYLGILHFRSHTIGYTNLFFKMAAKPPFQITNLSASVPLLAEPRLLPHHVPVAFPIGLENIPGTSQFIISYGSGDKSSHLSVFEWSDIDVLFKSPEAMPRVPLAETAR